MYPITPDVALWCYRWRISIKCLLTNCKLSDDPSPPPHPSSFSDPFLPRCGWLLDQSCWMTWSWERNCQQRWWMWSRCKTRRCCRWRWSWWRGGSGCCSLTPVFPVGSTWRGFPSNLFGPESKILLQNASMFLWNVFCSKTENVLNSKEESEN